MRRLSAVFMLCAVQIIAQANSNPSAWVYYDHGHLVYKKTAMGDTIMDFSGAGYQGGRWPIPRIPAAKRVQPSGADDTAAIQAAVNEIEARPLIFGFKGAVELAPGSYSVSASINVTASGVVLRGSGSGVDGTVINMTAPPAADPNKTLPAPNGYPQRPFLNASGVGSPAWTNAVQMTDSYVPAGSASFHVADPTPFAVGQEVYVLRFIKQAWIDLLGMQDLFGAAHMQDPETWESVGSAFKTPRTINSIQGNLIILDVPLSDSIDASYVAGELAVSTWTTRLENVGLEHLRIISPPQAGCFESAAPINSAVLMSNLKNGWVRDVTTEDMQNGINIGPQAQQVTVEDVSNTHTVITPGEGLYFEFIAAGTQILMQRVHAKGDHIFYMVTQSGLDGAQGPNVLFDSSFETFNADGSVGAPPANCPSSSYTNAAVEPHQRWATGLLVDNVQVPLRAINLLNRGYDGSGQGWAIGWGVIWNSSAATFTVQQPAGSENFCIGCTGLISNSPVSYAPDTKVVEPLGVFDSLGESVTPASLYRAQKRESRLSWWR